MSNQRLGCLGQFLALFVKPGEDTDALPSADIPKAMVNKLFVTPSEGAFFRVLREVVADRAHILSQVAVNRLIYFPGNERTNAGLRRWRSIINTRSVDFVIADKQTLRPLVAIELDDASHEKPDRQDRDGRIDLIFEAASLPLIRLKTKDTSDTRTLAKQLEPHLTRSP